jgi:hypothetical protein
MWSLSQATCTLSCPHSIAIAAGSTAPGSLLAKLHAGMLLLILQSVRLVPPKTPRPLPPPPYAPHLVIIHACAQGTKEVNGLAREGVHQLLNLVPAGSKVCAHARDEGELYGCGSWIP